MLRRALVPLADKVVQSPAVLRAAFITGSIIAFPAYPVTFVASLWAAAVWLLPRAIQNAQESHPRQPSPDPVTEAFAEFLQLELAQAREQIVRLQEEIKAVKRSPKERVEPRGHPVFRRVGLDQDCPRWVAEHVRRIYRTRLHPDKMSRPEHKREAERRFKEAEQTFDEIWRLRGF